MSTQAEAITFGERDLENETIRVQLCVSWRHNPDLVFGIEEDAIIESWQDAQEEQPPNVLQRECWAGVHWIREQHTHRFF